jgi:hypothetical protein
MIHILDGMSRRCETNSVNCVKRLTWTTLVLVGALSGCRGDAPTSSDVDLRSPSYAKGGGGSGGGGGGTGAAPSVNAVAPSSAVQDTTIDVTISGSGFTSGARAVWSLQGDTSLVHVKSTKYVSSTQLVAQILVPATAPVASYDVEVLLRDGKKGVGAELFEVLQGDPWTTFHFPLDDGALSVKSDGLYTSGGYSTYENGVCGVSSKIFASEAASNSGDAIMQTTNARSGGGKCATPRKLTLSYPDAVTETVGVFMNVRQVQNTTFAIPIGQTARRSFAIQTPRCEQLLWSGERQGVPIAADSVLVTRLGADSWRVQTQPPPNNRASCRLTGEIYEMTADFIITADRPLP